MTTPAVSTDFISSWNACPLFRQYIFFRRHSFSSTESLSSFLLLFKRFLLPLFASLVLCVMQWVFLLLLYLGISFCSTEYSVSEVFIFCVILCCHTIRDGRLLIWGSSSSSLNKFCIVKYSFDVIFGNPCFHKNRDEFSCVIHSLLDWVQVWRKISAHTWQPNTITLDYSRIDWFMSLPPFSPLFLSLFVMLMSRPTALIIPWRKSLFATHVIVCIVFFYWMQYISSPDITLHITLHNTVNHHPYSKWADSNSINLFTLPFLSPFSSPKSSSLALQKLFWTKSPVTAGVWLFDAGKTTKDWLSFKDFMAQPETLSQNVLHLLIKLLFLVMILRQLLLLQVVIIIMLWEMKVTTVTIKMTITPSVQRVIQPQSRHLEEFLQTPAPLHMRLRRSCLDVLGSRTVLSSSLKEISENQTDVQDRLNFIWKSRMFASRVTS